MVSSIHILIFTLKISLVKSFEIVSRILHDKYWPKLKYWVSWTDKKCALAARELRDSIDLKDNKKIFKNIHLEVW